MVDETYKIISFRDCVDKGSDFMKKWIGIVATLMLCMFFGMTAFAKENTVVALGADLSAEQRATVLSLMGLTEEELKDCEVITITNAQEHQYLDAYLEKSVIGTRSLTSVKMTKASKGAGINVTTQNVNYCTTGMYRNALLTAGVEDMNVYVVAPTPISGTAGLIGAIKAYEAYSNKSIPEKTIDTALDEMIMTGDIAEATKDVSNEEVEALMEWLKVKIASGELDTGDEKSVRDVIDQGEKQFGVSLADDEKNQIIRVLKKLDSMGLNGSYLIGQAEKIYKKYGLDAVNNASEVINEAVQDATTTAVKGFFTSIGDSFKGFFTKIFGK